MTDYYSAQSLSLLFYEVMAEAAGEHLRGDADFYAALAGDPPRSILELGAGSGRIGWNLAERGHRVVGLDLSADMLARALRKAPARSIAGSAAFFCADMTSFALDRRFDLVIAPFYAFSHLEGTAQRRAALAGIRAHLGPDGLAVLHLVSAPVLSAELPDEHLAQQRTVIRFRPGLPDLQVRIVERRVDSARRVCRQRVEYAVVREGLALRTSVEELRYGWMDEAERIRLLEEAGLRLVERRSSFTDRPGIEDILILAPL